nr:leukocyte tyrosine kinase receptor-like [Ciona intestinalis]|eukprot:XP_009860121.2 leukocyte tyrosine kinase receptor-like [Ciona intestinalis]
MWKFLLLWVISNAAAELKTEPIVELRWDFSSCGLTGRIGPTQNQCDQAYTDTNLADDVTVEYGLQTWTVPISGLYLITARGPSGLGVYGRAVGRGGLVTSEFRLNQGEKLQILVGQKSSYTPSSGSTRGPGGSGGTFVTRVSDSYVLMVAGGGSSSAGRNPPQTMRNYADAALVPGGKPGTPTPGIIDQNAGVAGTNGSGGAFGVMRVNGISSSGGGAGYLGNGDLNRVKQGELTNVDYPKPAYSYTSKRRTVRGQGGFFQFIDGLPRFNHGGFGGGGAGSSDGGAGGGGGYSGGAGGPPVGWGGGGGSVNNGEMSKKLSYNDGEGSVTISFIGYACCGPVVVYVGMCFVAGIIVTVLIVFLVYRCSKCIKKYQGKERKFWGKTKKGFYSFFKGNQEVENFAMRHSRELSHNDYNPSRSHENGGWNSRDRAGDARKNGRENYEEEKRSRSSDERIYEKRRQRDRSSERRRRRRRSYSSLESHSRKNNSDVSNNSSHDNNRSHRRKRRERRRRRSYSSDSF